MRGWCRAVGRELRHGVPVLGLVTLAVLVCVLLWSKGPDWGARWNELTFAPRDYVSLLAPVSVALGVWSGGRGRRSDTSELLDSSRCSALARASSEVVALAVASYVGLLVGVAGAAWSIVLVGGYGTWAAVAYLAGLFPTLLAYDAVGYALGRVASWRIVAPVAGVLTYGALGFASWDNPRHAVPMGGGPLGGTYGDPFEVAAAVWSGLGLLAAAALLLAAAATERRTAPSRSWAIAGVLGLLVLAGTVPLTVHAQTHRPRGERLTADEAVCTTDGGPQVCVRPEDRHLLGPMAVRARKVLAGFHGITGAPTWAGPFGLDLPPGQASRLDVLPGDTTPWGGPDHRPYVTMIADTLGYLSPAHYCRTGRFGALPGDSGEVFFDRSALAAGYVESGDTLEGEEGLGKRSVQARFRASSAAQRRDFTGRLVAAARHCDLSAAVAADAALARP